MRAKKPKRLPTVLTKDEVHRILSHLSGTHQQSRGDLCMGHPDLPQFVGDMAGALYFPERPG